MPKTDRPADVGRLLGALGLCARAGRLIYGVPMICDALRAGRSGKVPLLVLEAADTSPNTHKRITDRCAHYAAETVRLPVKGDELAHAVGHTGVLAAVGVTDPNLVRAVRAALPAQPVNKPPDSTAG